MADASPFQFQNVSVPRAYDEYLVPRLFTPWARVLLDSLMLAPGERVLDVACGPGVVTRMAAERVGPAGRVTGADISPPMLEIARGKPAPANAAPIDYLESPAAPLAVPDHAYDVVTCQHGFQFFPDRPAAATEIRRALKPGRRVGIAVWGPISECVHFSTLHTALLEHVPRDLADLLLLPFGWSSPEDLNQLLVDAGFQDVRIDGWELPLTFEAGPAQAAASITGTPLGPGLAEQPEATREALRRDLESRFALYTRDGAVHSKMSANIATART
jgi:ubiquinone/menaquinone biosynthesis C-methylase UbiE